MSVLSNSPTLHYIDLDGEHSFAIRGDSTAVGRSPDQDLVLKEAFVSRKHAVIMRQNGAFELIDQNSSHGTFLNGQRVQRAQLKSGDSLQFGSLNAVCFRFRVPEADTFSGSRATDLLSALSVFAPTEKNIPQPAREI